MSLPQKFAYLVSGVTGRLANSLCCPACECKRALKVDRKYFHTLFQCTECALVFRFPRDSEEAMKAFYQDDHVGSGLTTDLPGEVELNRLIEGNFVNTEKDFSFLVQIFDALSITKGARIMDYGANLLFVIKKTQNCR